MNIIVLPRGYQVSLYRVLGKPHIRGVHYIPYPISNIISQVDAQSSNPEYWASPIFGVFIISGVFGNCLVCLAISTERYIYEKRPRICFYLWKLSNKEQLKGSNEKKSQISIRSWKLSKTLKP